MRRPNILILYTDQQRWDALGANGNSVIHTPNLDRLAKESVNFDHCFVQNPVCMPSRVSFLTSQYPSTLRITHMGVPVPRECVTLAHMLSNYGYTSANIGKLHFLPHANRDHREIHPNYGFDHLEISDEPGCYEDAYRAWVRCKAPEALPSVSVGLPPAAQVWYDTLRVADEVNHPEERFPKRPVPFPASSHLTHTAFVAEQTVEFIRSHRDRPWLCIAGFYSPHSPWVAPREFLDLYDPAEMPVPKFPPHIEERRSTMPEFSDPTLQLARQGYYGMISEVDHHIGRILLTLDEYQLTEETIVVFTSDHGEWLGEHLRYGKGYPGHDGATRVPLIVRRAGEARAVGRTVSTVVEALDVVPTLLQEAGIQIPQYLQGESLTPLMQGEGGDASRAALTEHAGWKSLRTNHFRYTIEADGTEHLFDLHDRLGEYDDLVQTPSYSDELTSLRQQTLHKLMKIERPLPRRWPY